MFYCILYCILLYYVSVVLGFMHFAYQCPVCFVKFCLLFIFLFIYVLDLLLV